MEIERKYLVRKLPEQLEQYPYHFIEQAYLCTNPVVRIRKQDDDYILTWKGKGLLAREEYNLPLTEEGYYHLLEKKDGNVLTKKRYLIPLSNHLMAELDIFEGMFEGLVLVEVEFPDEASANCFTAPDWFGRDVTFQGTYQNSALSRLENWRPKD